jgi:hypothetical protein
MSKDLPVVTCHRWRDALEELGDVASGSEAVPFSCIAREGVLETVRAAAGRMNVTACEVRPVSWLKTSLSLLLVFGTVDI